MIKSVYEILQNAGLKQNKQILCAVSGGIDSVVMLHALKSFGLKCIVAHCNFKLRGEESIRDEKFVRDLADKMSFPIEVRTFETSKYADENNISIQMAARDLRFAFFDELLNKYGCDFIALGHNSDDQIETMLTNLVRGTGLRGLTGMSAQSEKYLRPLLNVSRNEIDIFAKENSLSHCDDSTNATTKYSRNKLRHIVIPALEEINPAAKNKILKTIDILKDNEKIFNEYVEKAYKDCVSIESDENINIDVEKLQKYTSVKTVLFEIFIKLNLPINLANDSVELVDAQTGRFCETEDLMVLRNRSYISISKSSKTVVYQEIKLSENSLSETLKTAFAEYSFSIENVNPDFKPLRDSNWAFLDYEKLTFPIKVRQKQDGDRFMPLGMKNFKKLKDFFTDMKVIRSEKSQIDIFTSGDDVIWVSGMRIDNRYKVTDKTTKVLKIEKKL